MMLADKRRHQDTRRFFEVTEVTDSHGVSSATDGPTKSLNFQSKMLNFHEFPGNLEKMTGAEASVSWVVLIVSCFGR